MRRRKKLAEKYILLTGGHSGIGLGVTKKLLKPGNQIGLIIRSEARRQEVMTAFDAFPADLVEAIDFFYADLSDQQQVHAVAKEIREKWPRIDRLFNNAGVVGFDRKRSKQGNEFHLEVNALAPYLLTQGLKPLLLASDDAKVITTVTGGMAGRKLRTDLILDDNFTRGMQLYPQSKQAAMLLLNDLSQSMPDVKFLTVNPGANVTNLNQREGTPVVIKFLTRIFFSDPEKGGGQRLYNAAFDPQFADANRVFLSNDKIVPIKHGLSEADKAILLAGIQP